MHFCCFKTPCPWQFATVTIGNSYKQTPSSQPPSSHTVTKFYLPGSHVRWWLVTLALSLISHGLEQVNKPSVTTRDLGDDIGNRDNPHNALTAVCVTRNDQCVCHYYCLSKGLCPFSPSPFESIFPKIPYYLPQSSYDLEILSSASFNSPQVLSEENS